MKKDTISNKKSELSSLGKKIDNLENELCKYRTIRTTLRDEIERLESEVEIEKCKFLLNKYWHCKGEYDNHGNDLYIKVNELYYDDEYYDDTVIKGETIETAYKNGELRIYSYMKEGEYIISDGYKFGTGINPMMLEEITDEEFNKHKKM